jgi:hypothetical protein
MGQQQLLLLVLGIVVVAFAVLAGMFAMDENMRKAAADNLVDRNLTIAMEAVYWKAKKDPYAGGNASYAGLETDGMKKLFLGEYTNDGFFRITYADDNNLQITAVSLRYPNIGVRTFVTGFSIDSTAIASDGSITAEP